MNKKPYHTIYIIPYDMILLVHKNIKSILLLRIYILHLITYSLLSETLLLHFKHQNNFHSSTINPFPYNNLSMLLHPDLDQQLHYFTNKVQTCPIEQQKLQSQSHFRKLKQQRLTKYICLAFLIMCLIKICFVIQQSRLSEGSKDQLDEIQKWTQFISADTKPENYLAKDNYWFSVSTRDLILNSDLANVYKRHRTFFEIQRSVHFRAILLTQMTHNVDFHGNVKVELSPFESDQRKKEKVIHLLMQYQKMYYQDQYQISQYENTQLPFCIIVPSYNNAQSKIYLRNLDSIFMQDYQNYRVIYMDDNSPDRTGEFVNQYVKERNIPEDKIKVIINKENKKAMQNIYQAVNEHCKNGEIVGIIDGDDSLNGRQVLKLYNALYHKQKLAFLYSNFLKIVDNSLTQFGFGNKLTKEYFEQGKLRNNPTLVCTHFMTFYVDLFKMTKKQDYTFQNGTFFDYAYDRAIITPLLELSYPRNYYLPEMIYEYRHDTGMNDAERDWYRVSNEIQSRKGYQSLKDFSFIDNHPVIKKGQEVKDKE